MPAISSRMSSSSSTTSNSGAISDPFFIPLIHFYFAYGFLFQRKHQAHFCARFVVLTVGERNLAAVLLDNLAYDREPQARSFGARRNVRFGQAMALRMRKPNAVVGNREHHAGRIHANIHGNAAAFLGAPVDAR